MRTGIRALFLSAGIAVCQSPAQTPLNTNGLMQNPTWLTQPRTDFSTLPPGWHMDENAPMKLFLQPSKAAPRWSEDAKIDPKMIVHPPQASLGMQQGIPIDQNQFANLQMLPIDSPHADINAIPAKWPNAKIQAIPTQWPRLEVHPVE